MLILNLNVSVMNEASMLGTIQCSSIEYSAANRNFSKISLDSTDPDTEGDINW